MKKTNKGFTEDISKFLENPTREGLREILKNNHGEFSNIDFKEQFPNGAKLARHILAIANSGGGCLVFGIAEKTDKSFEAVGVASLKDKADITRDVGNFLPSSLSFDDEVIILDFSFVESEYPSLKGKDFQIVVIDSNAKHLPYVAESGSGKDIRANAIYVRRGTENLEASNDELQKLINRRLETGYSSSREIKLVEHIEQLRALYGEIKQSHAVPKVFGHDLMKKFAETMGGLMKQIEVIPNPDYPKESVDEFIVSLIEKKKSKIKILLDVNDL